MEGTSNKDLRARHENRALSICVQIARQGEISVSEAELLIDRLCYDFFGRISNLLECPPVRLAVTLPGR